MALLENPRIKRHTKTRVENKAATRLMKILFTGGLGYIGSHTAVAMLHDNHHVVLADNLSNSTPKVLTSIKKICATTPPFFNVDLRDTDSLNELFSSVKPDVVIHLAGLKAVAESIARPLTYYENNVVGTLNLLSAMRAVGCNRVVFSSSATVYGPPLYLPLDESHPLSATNPYGQTKIDIELMLAHLCNSDPDFSAISLRYFNPIGAHESALLGDNPQGIPNNLLPFITRVAKGELMNLKIFGDDYETVDGTGIRDYIHVKDLAAAHVAAVDWAYRNKGYETINVGTGKGYSVLEVIQRFQTVNKVKVSYTFEDRRSGDVAQCYSACDKAAKVLGFRAKYDLDAMLSSAWAWEQSKSNNFERPFP